jgi:hypothetical protein
LKTHRTDPCDTVKRSLLVFSFCLAGLTLLAYAISFVNSVYLHRDYPYDTFLFDPAYRFTDFTGFYQKILDLGGGGEVLGLEPRFNYPAPALYVYAFFIRPFPHPLETFLIFTAGTAVLALAVLGWKLHAPGLNNGWIDASLVAVVACSYPFLIMIDRGNIEGVAWLFTCLGLVCFVKERYLGSCLFLAAAICVKPFPALFFFLFLREKRFKEIAIAFIAVCAANLTALKAVGPTIQIAYEGLHKGVSTYVYNYIGEVRFKEIGFDHSLFSCLKQVLRLSLGWNRDYVFHSPLLAAYRVWIAASVVIALGTGYYFWRKPVINRLFAIVVLMLVLPPISPDYTLAYIYLPWGAFMIFLTHDVGTGRVKFPLRHCLWVLVPCAILMSPQSYLIFGGVAFAGQVKALALVLLFVVAARIDMPSSLFHELPAAETSESGAEGPVGAISL